MKKVLALAGILSITALASATVDIRLWVAPASSVPVAWAGAGGPFSPTSIGTSTATGGVGAHVYSTTTVGSAGLGALPAPGVALDGDGASGELYAILARTDNSLEAGSAVRGLNLRVASTGDLSWDVAWTQWSGPTGAWRWETSSDLEGPEVTIVGGLGGPGRGWVLGPTTGTADRLDRWDENPETGEGLGGILLGYIRTNSGTGDLTVRLGSNGINHAIGTRVAFSDGLEYISGGVGAVDRGYGVQLSVVPEPASLILVVLAAGLIRRRA
jgi:hypothetical protein